MTGTSTRVKSRVSLPRRPRLLPGLPVVERRTGELQIGLDPRHAVVAPNLPPILMDVLRTLDGRRSTATLLALVHEEHADRLRAMLHGLAEYGLVEDAEPHSVPGSGTAAGLRGHGSPPATQSIGIHGGGRLAAAVTALLTRSGVGTLAVSADGIVSRSDLGSGLHDGDVGRERGTAIADLARRINPDVRIARLRPDRTTDLVLLTDAVVPAPEVITALTAAGTPHLVTRVRDGIGIVGPLVVPGRSSCTRCADLHRTARDSCWPRIAGQLAGRYPDADLTSVHGTAALTVGQVLRTLSTFSTASLGASPPPTWNATLELDCVTGAVRTREWPPHPRCVCGARSRPHSR